MANLGPDDLFAIVAGEKDSPFVSRRTIRQLAGDATAVEFEEYIHTARIQAVMCGTLGTDLGPAEIANCLNNLADPFEVRARMNDADYLLSAAPFNIV